MHTNEAILAFSGAQELEAHLCAASGASGGAAGFWLKLAKVGARIATVGKEGATEAAKADGRWDAAYASQGTAQMPEDLAVALASNEAARRFFETLDGANRHAIV